MGGVGKQRGRGGWAQARAHPYTRAFDLDLDTVLDTEEDTVTVADWEDEGEPHWHTGGGGGDFDDALGALLRDLLPDMDRVEDTVGDRARDTLEDREVVDEGEGHTHDGDAEALRVVVRVWDRLRDADLDLELPFTPSTGGELEGEREVVREAVGVLSTDPWGVAAQVQDRPRVLRTAPTPLRATTATLAADTARALRGPRDTSRPVTLTLCPGDSSITGRYTNVFDS